jgi:ubiquinone biosynthesis protein UbiJ
MKQFTNTKNDKQSHYANNEIMKNKLYDIIDENLIATIDGNVNENLTITGKEMLVDELMKIVKNSEIDTNIELLKKFGKYSTQKLSENVNPLMEAFAKVNEKKEDN